MPAAPALLEIQCRFLASLYDDAEPGPLEAIAGNGLDPAARLRIYRHSCSETQVAVLRTIYPGVLALVGEEFFEQSARGYRRAHPSHSGNLQAFGAQLADYLEQVPEARALPYLPDVARLEWLRQEAALAIDAETLSPDALPPGSTAADGLMRIAPHPSVRLFASRHPIMTIWRYAMDPTPEPLQLPDHGERVALWREDGGVAMAALDAASFTCLEALARGAVLCDAHRAAQAADPSFELPACIESFVAHGLIAAHPGRDGHPEHPAWR